MAVVRLMFDTTGYNALTVNPETFERLRALVERGAIAVLKTHVQEDELRNTESEAKRAALLAVYHALGTEVPTSGGVWDVSRWDQFKSDDGTGDVKLGDVMTSTGNHTEDALTAATAAAEVDILVTNDRRLGNRIRAQNSRVPPPIHGVNGSELQPA
jgi:hypothetical protein